MKTEMNVPLFELEEEKRLSRYEVKKLAGIHKAVFENQLKKVKKLMSEEKDVDKADGEYGITALYLAVCLGLKDITEALLTPEGKSGKKSNPNIGCGHNTRTPLMMVRWSHSCAGVQNSN